MKHLLLVFLFACGGGSKSAPPPTPDPQPEKQRTPYEELEARLPEVIGAMEALANDLTAVKEDCPKIAAVLRKWGSQWTVELDAMFQLKQKLTPEERERYEHEHEDDAKRLRPVFEAAMTGCEGNPEVQEALSVAGFRRVKMK